MFGYGIERRVDRLEEAVLSLEETIILLQLEILALRKLLSKKYPAPTGIKVTTK